MCSIAQMRLPAREAPGNRYIGDRLGRVFWTNPASGQNECELYPPGAFARFPGSSCFIMSAVTGWLNRTANLPACAASTLNARPRCIAGELLENFVAPAFVAASVVAARVLSWLRIGRAHGMHHDDRLHHRCHAACIASACHQHARAARADRP